MALLARMYILYSRILQSIHHRIFVYGFHVLVFRVTTYINVHSCGTCVLVCTIVSLCACDMCQTARALSCTDQVYCCMPMDSIRCMYFTGVCL